MNALVRSVSMPDINAPDFIGLHRYAAHLGIHHEHRTCLASALLQPFGDLSGASRRMTPGSAAA
jgi:hypothetical protein